MRERSTGILMVLATVAPWSTTARGEVPLAELTTAQVQAAAREVPNVPEPEGLTYAFTNGGPTLSWALSPAAMRRVGGEDPDAVKQRLGAILVDALGRRPVGPGGRPLLTAADVQQLQDVLVVVPRTPPAGPAAEPAPVPQPPDQPPTIVGPAVVNVPAGAMAAAWYDPVDRETPPTALAVAVAQVSDPALLPEGSLRLEVDGPRRRLTIATSPERTGSATITLTVTDAAGQSARTSTVVNVTEAPSPEPIPLPPPTLVPVYTYQPGPGSGSAAGGSAAGGMIGPCGCAGLAGSSIMGAGGGGGQWVQVGSTLNFGPVIPRNDLVRGRTAADGPALFNAAYESYWAGNYAQAVEAAAAAAALWDDPRAWDYLALSTLKAGDTGTAQSAARYSAARVVVEPGFRPAVATALVRVQGPDRLRLNELKAGIPDRRTAQAILAARPDVLSRRPAPAPAPAGGEAANTNRAETGA